ncbi:CDP-diacylglycerol--serine O-phosphatidyltransferase [hydrothermal vent metagenome]|uniref:CDP-diacylglycerol--serine O-phosphatidyltransferase n=1 Tax=hydrothermal vent metagenome TaxID=652676 RepID=A0A3B0ZVS0_9ZZZZ
MDKSDRAKRYKRGIYLLPNLFTTAALFCGFYAIIAAMQNNFIVAAIAIFIAMLLDGLDGRVARLTNTQSDFGAQYDSLADLISFGLAPSLVMYQWSLLNMGKAGWLVAFIYAATAALRLARFNTQVGTADKNFFQGLPSPAAAALVAGAVWVGQDYSVSGRIVDILAMFVTVTSGLLMVSNIRYNSFKGIDFKGKIPFFLLLVIMLVIVFISYEPAVILFGIFVIYAISGPVYTLVELRKRRAMRRAYKKARKLRKENKS